MPAEPGGLSDRTRSGKVSERKRYKQDEAAMRAWQPRCYVTGWLRHQDAGNVVDIGDTFAGACTDLGYGFHCPGGGSAILVMLYHKHTAKTFDYSYITAMHLRANITWIALPMALST
jgi:hypothetical protein